MSVEQRGTQASANAEQDATQASTDAEQDTTRASTNADARPDPLTRMRELQALTRQMAETLDFEAVFDRVSEAVRSRTPASAVSVFEVSGESADLLSSDLDEEGRGGQLAIPFWRVPLDASLAALLDRVRAEGTAWVDDTEATPELSGVAHPGMRSLLLAGHLPGGEADSPSPHLVVVAASDEPGAFASHHAEDVLELAHVTALALRNARLYEDARAAAERDALTGLRNRRVFWDALRTALEDATPERPVTLAAVDIDDYKAVNDRYGHAVGDLVLTHIADRLARSTRETDAVFRFGGDEFAILMPGASRAQAQTALRRCARAVERQRREDLPAVTLSAGMAVAPEDAAEAEGLFRAADHALYDAKAAGKSRLAPGPGQASCALHGPAS
ncbi:sensor domain-containing diguanylate cyclase [Egibacter rhizosphaerae]|uniref:Sensor domain-containing diguanylate cyclase n=1 Tax=Egibacter rhizosphaerae TaxID=1670831 RepID=A0A411YJZ2_9ACTN|nr:sensor domain-containing diguanylate cyclase [Egibacter rhizosphaerae]QBI21529.1 sensor domain-containing diguanylate cyclase [Egibacter rhizosphaerae]